jgi:hypothetical protein
LQPAFSVSGLNLLINDTNVIVHAISGNEVKPAVVRQWLRDLSLAPKSNGHLRGLMRRLFDFAMLWEIIEVQRNPIELVRG